MRDMRLYKFFYSMAFELACSRRLGQVILQQLFFSDRLNLNRKEGGVSNVLFMNSSAHLIYLLES